MGVNQEGSRSGIPPEHVNKSRTECSIYSMKSGYASDKNGAWQSNLLSYIAMSADHIRQHHSHCCLTSFIPYQWQI